jgi:hypothetical protein
MAAHSSDLEASNVAIQAVLEGLERAVTLLPAGELIWKGRFLRLRAVLAEEAKLPHVHDVARRSDAGLSRRSVGSPRESRAVQGSGSVG